MPSGIHSVLLSHLTSEYRGPRILNEEGNPPPPATPPAPAPAGDSGTPPATPPATPPKADDTEGRISQLAKENKELKEWKKEQERLKKEEEDKKLQESGEHQKLAEQYKTESATEKAAREAAEARATKFETLMKKQIEDQLAAITDKEKKVKITALLGDKPVEEQMEMLPNILGLMGVAPTSFGGPTPTSTTTPDKTDLSVKKARHAELVKKAADGTATGSERGELHRLGFELSAELRKEEEAKKAPTT